MNSQALLQQEITQKMQQKTFLFWLLQVIGFTGYGISFYLPRVYLKDSHIPPYYSLYITLICIAGIVVTLGLRWFYRYTWEMKNFQRVTGFILGSAVATLVWTGFRYFLFQQMGYQEEGEGITLNSVLIRASSDFWIMAGWTGLYAGVKYYLILQDEREQRLKLAALAQEAQLKMLRYQLNPHFLFNTLNAISTLILDRDNALAGTMVTRLSNFLRYSLDNDPIQKVPLEQEIEALNLYLEIEKVRFDERLQVHFNIEEQVANAQVPSLLLQPLVENSIKYAITQAEDGGMISIDAKRSGNELLLSVADNGPGISNTNQSNKGAGVGIRNTSNRLVELYGENHSFELDQVEPHGLKISIRIPFEVKSEEILPTATASPISI